MQMDVQTCVHEPCRTIQLIDIERQRMLKSDKLTPIVAFAMKNVFRVHSNDIVCDGLSGERAVSKKLLVIAHFN